MMNVIPFNLNELISRYRLFIMGIAMISIILFHQKWLHGGFYDVMHSCGLWGVDVFLVISGFGIVRSLERNDLRTFYRNRIKRIMPACVVMGILSVACVVMGIIETPRKLFLYLMPLSFHQWYIDAILIYYALSPILLRLITRYGKIFLLAVVVSCFFIQAVDFSIPWPLSWAIERIPAFCVGMWIYTKRCLLISYWHIIWMIGGGVFLYWVVSHNILVWGNHTYRYLMLLPVMPLLFYISAAIAKFLQYIKLERAIEWIGKYSLEIYLAHALVFHIMKGCTIITPYVTVVIAVVVSIVLSYLLKLLTKQMNNK